MRRMVSPYRSTKRSAARGVLSRLARDKKGNTLAMVGAALVPLTAMIGSGVDMSRAYMAKQRLQSACDAAALGGRRVLIGADFNQNVIDEANRFFDFNFHPGLYQTAAFEPVVTNPSAGTVRVAASTTIPTSIMRLFGYTTLPLSVTCDASQNYINTDVMLVLDVTGSMAEEITVETEDEDGDGDVDTEEVQKIAALRDAVMELYDALAPTQTTLQNAGMRLRYGVVPYSSTVNVSALSMNADHIANTVRYQSRSPIFLRSGSTTTTSTRSYWQCRNLQTIGWSNIQFDANGAAIGYQGVDNDGANDGNDRDWLDHGICTVTTGTYTRTDTRSAGGEFAFYYHEPRDLDASRFKTRATDVPLPTALPGSGVNAARWNGCIEERATVPTITANSSLAVPPNAWDLNINHIPDSDATRWRPQWSQVVFQRYNSNFARTTNNTPIGAGVGAACPAPARRLTAWTRADLQTYVNALQPTGSTYHDIGMAWGARLLSSQGIFADSPSVFNRMPVARHIIFMTDGQMHPNAFTYGFQGIEYMDQRVTGTASTDVDQGDTLAAIHNRRFRMLCNAAPTEIGGATIWVIAFGTTLNSDLEACASSEDHAFTANTKGELIAQFRAIAQQIGALRLTQ